MLFADRHVPRIIVRPILFCFGSTVRNSRRIPSEYASLDEGNLPSGGFHQFATEREVITKVRASTRGRIALGVATCGSKIKLRHGRYNLVRIDLCKGDCSRLFGHWKPYPRALYFDLSREIDRTVRIDSGSLVSMGLAAMDNEFIGDEERIRCWVFA